MVLMLMNRALHLGITTWFPFDGNFNNYKKTILTKFSCLFTKTQKCRINMSIVITFLFCIFYVYEMGYHMNMLLLLYLQFICCHGHLFYGMENSHNNFPKMLKSIDTRYYSRNTNNWHFPNIFIHDVDFARSIEYNILLLIHWNNLKCNLHVHQCYGLFL